MPSSTSNHSSRESSQDSPNRSTVRRQFLKATGVAAASTAAATAISAAKVHAAEDAKKLIVGVIGTGGMGSNHTRELAGRKDVQVKYVCDVDRNRLGAAGRIVEERSGRAPQAVDDLRKVLDDKQVDAVYIATPDHWHAPAAILALDAGKHVYVEKPCCHNIREGRMMVDAVKRTGKVLQVGTQSRSAPFLKEAMQRLREGEIGEIRVAKAWNSQRRGSIGKTKPSEPPPELNYDRWLGPAPATPFRRNMLHSIWRWWYAFGCGDIGNDGVHDLDVALWGLPVQSHPTSAACLGGKYYFDDDMQFPDTQYAVLEYPRANSQQKLQLIFEQRIWSPYVQESYENGAAFYGDRGMMLVGHTRGWRMYGPRNKLLAERTGRPSLADHYTDFFKAIRDGGSTAANAEIGHRSATVVHLANIAARTRSVLNFDPEKERIVDNEEADRLIGREYRDHWATPKQPATS